MPPAPLSPQDVPADPCLSAAASRVAGGERPVPPAPDRRGPGAFAGEGLKPDGPPPPCPAGPKPPAALLPVDGPSPPFHNAARVRAAVTAVPSCPAGALG